MPYFPSGAAANALTGTTLASNVVSSSLGSTAATAFGFGGGTNPGAGTTDVWVNSANATDTSSIDLKTANVLRSFFYATNTFSAIGAFSSIPLLLLTNNTARLTIDNSNLTIASGFGLKLGNAATTGLTAGVLAALTNATVVISDSTGQAYRIPCII